MWKVKALAAQSCPTFCNPMDCSRQAPLSMGVSRQEHWSGSPCPPPGDLPDPGIEPRSCTLWADSLPAEPPEKPASSFRYLSFLSYFPGDPVVQILRFHCRGCGFNPWLRQWRSHMPCRKKKKKSIKQTHVNTHRFMSPFFTAGLSWRWSAVSRLHQPVPLRGLLRHFPLVAITQWCDKCPVTAALCTRDTPLHSKLLKGNRVGHFNITRLPPAIRSAWLSVCVSFSLPQRQRTTCSVLF